MILFLVSRYSTCMIHVHIGGRITYPHLFVHMFLLVHTELFLVPQKQENVYGLMSLLGKNIWFDFFLVPSSMTWKTTSGFWHEKRPPALFKFQDHKNLLQLLFVKSFISIKEHKSILGLSEKTKVSLPLVGPPQCQTFPLSWTGASFAQHRSCGQTVNHIFLGCSYALRFSGESYRTSICLSPPSYSEADYELLSLKPTFKGKLRSFGSRLFK